MFEHFNFADGIGGFLAIAGLVLLFCVLDKGH